MVGEDVLLRNVRDGVGDPDRQRRTDPPTRLYVPGGRPPGRPRHREVGVEESKGDPSKTRRHKTGPVNRPNCGCPGVGVRGPPPLTECRPTNLVK